MGSSAKVLASADLRRLLAFVGRERGADRSRCMVLLSFRAGLRACEIAGLDWSMVACAGGRISQQISVSGTIAKNGRARCIPIHVDLAVALRKLHGQHGKPASGPIIRSQRGGHLTPRSVVNWFGDVYQQLGFEGCSSHSGRRTFITQSARLLAKSGGSLRDIQELAGHRALTTTERYIEGDREAQRKLIRLL